MKRCWLLTAFFAVSCVLVAAQARAQCHADDTVVRFKGGGADFGEYGLLFHDAQESRCYRNAATWLADKLEDELRLAGFHGFLAGGDVYLAMATGLILGGKGPLAIDRAVTDRLDAALYRLATTTDYSFDLSCNAGHQAAKTDTCMDEYVTAAAAYAWMAAYLAKTGRPAGEAMGRARTNLDLSFSLTDSVCVRPRGMDPTLNCNACQEPDSLSLDALYNGILNDTLEVDSYNGVLSPTPDLPNPPPSGENPNYGVGLLTSVAAAVTGLRVAGFEWSPSDLQKVIAQGLTRQGQKRIDGAVPAGSCGATWSHNACLNLNDHLNPTLYPNIGVCTPAVDCADPGKTEGGVGVYRPTFYPVHDILFRDGLFRFSDRRSPLVLDGRFAFDCPAFPDDAFSNAKAFLGDARLAVYRDLGWKWLFGGQPTLGGLNFPPLDVTPPQMYIDVPQHYQTVSGVTNVYGWAIDAVSGVTLSFQIDDSRPLSGIGYGGTRPDVCATLQIPKDPACSVGWGGFVNTTAYANGLHTLSVTASDASGNRGTFSRLFVINNVGACQASPPVGPSNLSAANAGYYDYVCGYYKYTLGSDPSGYCNQAVSNASTANINTAGTGTCSGGTVYNYYAGVYDYYCRYYEYYGLGWDYGGYCSLASSYASAGACTGCGQVTPPPCQGTARTIWIQPQWRAGFGPENSLVFAGSASSTGSCGSGGVDLYWRVLFNGPWQHVPYSAPVGSDGIWYNAIENANPFSVYETYVTYKNGTASYCTYDGRNDIVWCQ